VIPAICLLWKGSNGGHSFSYRRFFAFSAVFDSLVTLDSAAQIC